MALTAILATAFLLALNAFFAMAEFAVVRVRPTRVAELVRGGNRRAVALAHIQANIDEYLSVVQVGITLAGVGLGLVLDRGLSLAVERLLPVEGTVPRLIGLAVALATGTYLSVVLGELVPKALALRDTERLALRCAPFLRMAHRLFWLPLQVLTVSARAILRLIGFGEAPKESPYSERELRDILGASQRGGLMSFRRLLMVENVFDFGELRARDAMRPREQARTLDVDSDEDRVTAVVREHRFSRYLVVDPALGPSGLPLGVAHVKDLFARTRDRPLDLRALARPYLTFTEEDPLEQVLVRFQRSHRHLAIVVDSHGRWTGILALEDVLEDVVGQIHDEFERDPLELEDVLRTSRILLGVNAGSIEGLVRRMLAAIGDDELPAGSRRDALVAALLDRERSLSTHVGGGVLVPHARVEGLKRPLMVFARLDPPLPADGRSESVRMAFLLLTSATDQRSHLRLLSRIANVVDSEYVLARLAEAATAEEAVAVMVAGAHVASS